MSYNTGDGEKIGFLDITGKLNRVSTPSTQSAKN